MATSKSAGETFSRLGTFGDRDMPTGDHIPDPIARKIVVQSDKTFGNRYNRCEQGRALDSTESPSVVSACQAFHFDHFSPK